MKKKLDPVAKLNKHFCGSNNAFQNVQQRIWHICVKMDQEPSKALCKICNISVIKGQ